MSKKPKYEHEYHAGKDKLKIVIQGYSLKSKSAREKILKKMSDELDECHSRLISEAKTNTKKSSKKQKQTSS